MKSVTKVILLLSLSTIVALSATIHTKRRVSSKYDDAEENALTGKMFLHSPGLDFVKDNGEKYIVGLRFKNVKVPKDVTITKAYIQFSSHEINSEPTNLTIYGEKYIPARKFGGKNGNISSRIKTSSSVNWNNIPAWEKNRERGDKEKSSDISSIVQEIINQDNWHKGRAMVFIVSGDGKRVAKSYNASHSNAPTLVIEYDDSTSSNSSTPSTNHIPLANAGNDQTLNFEENGTEVQLDGSSSTDPDGDALTYNWSFISEPDGSSATLDDFTSIKPTFTAIVAGDYKLQLIVSDGQLNSNPDIVNISIEENEDNNTPIPSNLDPTTISATIFD